MAKVWSIFFRLQIITVITFRHTPTQVPSGVSFAEASSIPLALATAAFGLILPFDPKGRGGAGIKPFWEDGAKDAYKNKPMVVLGGSSAVGQFGI